jgi:hypothetical protein
VTLLAGWVGVYYGSRQVIIQKRLEFYERQLKEFYSPIVGYRNEIHVKSNLRVRISSVAEISWRELCDKNQGMFQDEASKSYDRIIHYDNKQFQDELLPLYEKMLAIFRDNLWFAEPETAKYYPMLCEFVELWKRLLSGNLPADVVNRLGLSEEKLESLYKELDKQIEILKNKLLG